MATTKPVAIGEAAGQGQPTPPRLGPKPDAGPHTQDRRGTQCEYDTEGRRHTSQRGIVNHDKAGDPVQGAAEEPSVKTSPADHQQGMQELGHSAQGHHGTNKANQRRGTDKQIGESQGTQRRQG